jgi:DtxR family Mn-dependent transcriptional regulator
LALAKHILRKHRLWETFLVEKLGFGWEEVHPLAEQLEHVQSRELVEKLATYLGSPIHDPHGDPIPQADGAIPPTMGEPLQQFSEGSRLRIVRVEDAGTDFFNQLDQLNISLGKEFTLISISNFDSSIQLKATDGSLFWLSHSMSSNIYAISL